MSNEFETLAKLPVLSHSDDHAATCGRRTTIKEITHAFNDRATRLRRRRMPRRDVEQTVKLQGGRK